MGQPPQQQHQQQQRGKGKTLFYAIVAFAVCWLQLSANVFVYFLKHQGSDSTTMHQRFGRFPVSRSSSSSSSVVSNMNMDQSKRTDKAPSNLRSGREENKGLAAAAVAAAAAAAAAEAAPSNPAALEVQLLDLFQRLENVQTTLEKEILAREESSFSYTSTAQSTETTNTDTKPRKVFVPFTIRDAQRTVPTQIPHGFEVFDFIDLYSVDQNQTQTAASQQQQQQQHKAKIFHNGKPIPEIYNSEQSYHRHNKGNGNANDDDSECLVYSKKCYRSKFIKILRYLLSLRKPIHKKGVGGGSNNNNSNNNVEYYYFYMEADNDLCVPLHEIRDLAFEHERYFISTGIGASGWIMSQSFLEDFYFFWNTLDEDNQEGLDGDQILEPDSVAAVLLQQNQAWSVTRRYLTSHSILVGNTADAASISALYERVETNSSSTAAAADADAKRETEGAAPRSEKASGRKRTKKAGIYRKETPEEAAKKAPLMEPSRYLPRCLEPHRGVWTKKKNENGDVDDGDGDGDGFDIEHWGFFDYDRCPESEIFPCQEGQLEELAKLDPFFRHQKKGGAT